MIVASVNPQPQQTRPGNEMFGEIVPHPQGSSALLNETSMVKVHPLPPQPSGPVDISVVPYDGFVQHAYSQSSAQPPPHHPSNQIHDAVVISSSQHPGQPHGAVMPSYMQQQQMAHPSQVQSQDNLLLGHYQQSAHPHDLVLSSPHQQYSPHPPGAIVFASPQNAYPQPHEILSAQQQFVGQPSPPHFPGVLMSPTHQHPSFGPHDGVVHTGQAITNQPPYPMHDPLLSPSPHHAGLLHPPVMVNPHMSNSALPGQPPVPAGNPHQYPGQLHGSVIPAFHSQYPGSLQGTVVPGPPPPNGMIPPTPQHAAPLHGAVVPPNQHPNPLTGGIISPMHQHQNPGLLHNSLLPSPGQQHPGSLQGTIVSHQHTSPIHSAAVMPTHHHQQQQQQHHPAAIFGNLTSHHQHPGSLHPSVLPCPRQHPSSGRLHNNPGSSSSRQQHGVLPTPSLHHYSSSKSNDNDSAASHHLASSSSSSSSSSTTSSSSSSSSSSSLSSSSKGQESTGGSTTPTTMTTTNSTAGSRHSPKVINSTITTPSQPMSTQSKFFSTSTVSSSVASDSNGQNLSQHVPIKKLGTLASKSNNYNDTRINHKTGQSYKDLSSSSHSNDSTTQQGSNKISTSTYNNNSNNSNNSNNNQHHHHHHHGPWELRNSYSIHSSSYKNASVPSTSSETNVNTTDRSVSTSHRTLPSRSSIIPPRMSLSVNGMLPPGNNMVGKFFGYQHSNGSTTNSRAISPLSSKKDSASSSSSSDVDAITTGLEKSRLHDNNQFYRQLDNTNGNTRRRYVSESWRRQNGEAAAASYTYTKQQQPLWSSSPKDQIKVVNLPVDQMKRPVYPLKVSKNSYSSVEGTKNQPRDTLHLTFFLH